MGLFLVQEQNAAFVIYLLQPTRRMEVVMSLANSWCTVKDATEKYGLEKGQILQWVENGLVRAEEFGGKVERVNIDDLDLKVQELTGI
jgi:hypothetical protein